MKLGAQVINAVQRRTHASFGHNAVALAARGTDVAGEDRPCRGYAVSQRKRKRIKEPFGWGKTDRRTCMGSSSSNAGNIY